MNKIFRLVWNRGLAAWTVTSELASSVASGPQASRRCEGGSSTHGARRGAAGMLLFSLLAPAMALAGELDGGKATGTNDPIAIGNGATATGDGAISIGSLGSAKQTSTASGRNSLAVGNQSMATDEAATAIGVSSVAAQFAASAFGRNATANGDSSVAIGSYAEAQDGYGIAMGNLASAEGNSATAIGAGASTLANNAVALGKAASATQADSVAIGYLSIADRGNAVSIGSSTLKRQLVNLANGTQSTDAVNVSQLTPAVNALGGGARVNSDGSVTGPSYSVGGTTATTVGDALTRLDGRVTGNMTTLNNINKGAGIKYFHTNSTQADSAATGLDSVAIGPQAKASATDTVALGNGSSAPNTGALAIGAASVGGGNYGTAVGQAANVSAAYGTAVGNGAQSAGDSSTALGRDANAAGQNSVAVGYRASAAQAGAVALGDGSSTAAAVATKSGVVAGKSYTYAGTAPASTVSVGKAGAERTVTNVAAGRVTSGSTDAVNGSQLFATNQAVDGVDSRVTTLNNQINNGTAGLVQQDAATKLITVAKDKDGTQVDFTGTEGARKLTGVAKGDISATSTDAVNGGQLSEVDGRVTNIDGRVTNNTNEITRLGDQINSGTTGLVQYDAATKLVTVAKDKDGTQVDFAGTDGTRKLTGIAKGEVSETSTEAVNGAQLYGTNKSVADSLGGGAKVNPDGSISGPTYTVGGKTVNNVGDAVSNLDGRVTDVDGRVTSIDGRVTNNTNEITKLGDQINSGTTGLVQYDAATKLVTVAKDQDGTQVDFAGTDGTRKLTGVAKGDVSATSTDAVNGGQLSEVDGRVTNNTTEITRLGDQLNSGAVGLVQYDAATKLVTVAKDQDGTQVDFTGTDGERKLIGVAKGEVGEASTEAVNGAQLYGTNKSVADSLGGGAKVNPDGSITGPTYTVGGKTVNNVGDVVSNLDGRVSNNTTLINAMTQGGGIRYFRANSTREDSVASGADSVAIGPMALASATQAVALGADSVADRAYSVAVGSAQRQRQIVYVAKGSADTDAVNVAQLRGVTDAMGGGARIDDSGTMVGPTYNVGGRTVNNVGDALTAVDGRVSNVDQRVTQLGDQINNSGLGLVKQDATSRDVTIGRDNDGRRVDFRGSEGERVLAGVAAGALSAASIEAVNGSQLHATNQAIAAGLGGGAKVDPDGSITGPTYRVDGGTVNNAGDAISNIDSRVNNNSQAIQAINEGRGVKYFHANSSAADAQAIGAESIAAGPQARAEGAESIAIGSGAQAQADNSVAIGAGAVADRAGSVSVGSAGGERAITHVAAGTADTDAVNVSQLRAAQSSTVQYDRPAPDAAPDPRSLTLGVPGAGGTTVHNVNNGVAPMDAVNVRQLQSGMAEAVGQSRAYTDQRIEALGNDVWDVRRESRAGTASAIAMAGLVQAYEAGDSLLSVGMGSFQGEYSMAMGLSGVTGDGKYLYKAQASGNTRKDFGFSVSAGWRW